MFKYVLSYYYLHMLEIGNHNFLVEYIVFEELCLNMYLTQGSRNEWGHLLFLVWYIFKHKSSKTIYSTGKLLIPIYLVI